MIVDELNKNHIFAEEGKVFRRIEDGLIAGKEIYLGYNYHLNGELLSTPELELPEQYEEIDEPITPDMEIITDDNPLMPTKEEIETLEEQYEGLIPEELQRVTYADYMNLKKEVEHLKEILWQNYQVL